MITIEGKKYKVVENMGYVHDRGAYGKVIDYNGKEVVVLKIAGKWELAKPLFIISKPITGQN